MLKHSHSKAFGGGQPNLSSPIGFLRNSKKGFTLAEVLITLGIIGMVAVMTLPTLISSYQRKVISARNKKFVSSINQAVLRSTIDNEAPDTWVNRILYQNPDDLYDWFDNYIMQYMKVLKNCRRASDSDSRACVAEYKFCEFPDERCKSAGNIVSSQVLYIFNDGSMITAVNGGGLDNDTGLTTCLTIHIRFDTNGYAKPNIYGRDIFSYRFTINKNKFYIECDDHKNITGGTVSMSNSRETLIDACKTNPQTCSCLLMKDGYEIKDDYPHRM